MINLIRVLSRHSFQRCVEDLSETVDGALVRPWYAISIYGDEGPVLTPEVVDKLRQAGLQDSLSLFFDDTDDSPKYAAAPELVPFSDDQARRIVEFVDRAQASREDGVLVVHCYAGISRSGAVGSFVRDYLGLDKKSFMQTNPYVYPNHFVLAKLLNAAKWKDTNEQPDDRR